MASRKRKLIWTLVVVVVLLIGARLYLPVYLQDYVNKTLDSAEGYNGTVGDIDLAIWRGAYVINDIEINKASGEVFAPLFSADAVDLSILMPGLLRGELVGEVVFHQPMINIVAEAGDTPDDEVPDNTQQTGEQADWRRVVTDLFPLRFDLIEIRQGELHFRKPEGEPPVNVYLTHLDAKLRNLTNSRDLSDTLAATLELESHAMRNGRLSVTMEMDPYRDQPHFNLNGKLLNLEMAALDDFIRAYTPIDLEAGNFDLVMELAARDGRITGYAKPLLRNIEVFEWREDVEKQGDNIFQAAWEGLVGGITEILQNQSEDQFATRIPIDGQIDAPDTSAFAAVISVLSNAFVAAFEAKLEGGVTPSDTEDEEE